MTPLRQRVVRAVLAALVILALSANVAAADDLSVGNDCVPYDPGLPSASLTDLLPLWPFWE